MDAIGPIIASSLAGLNQAERIAANDKKRAEEKPIQRIRRTPDETDLEVNEVEPVEAPRAAKGNDQEESHEDRQQHGHYDSQGTANAHRAPKIDLKG